MDAAAARLTPRQQECVALTWQGLVNKEIARRLGISAVTVKAHLALAYRTLDVAENPCPRTRAAVWLWRACARAAGRRD